jgi:hypothetical protein
MFKIFYKFICVLCIIDNNKEQNIYNINYNIIKLLLQYNYSLIHYIYQ